MRKPLIAMIFFMLAFNIFPADNTTDEKKGADEKWKFPGKIGLSFTQEADFDTIGSKPGVNYGWSDIYMRSTARAGLAFPFKFYTITPWIGDYAELPFWLASGGEPVKVDTKNNFQFGFNNAFSFENIIEVDLGFEFKLGSPLGANPVTGNSGDGIELRLTPTLNLSGSYDFGLSWSLGNNFEFYLYPDKNHYFQFFDFEGNYNIAFDYFHFFAPKKIKGAVYAELYLWTRAVSDGANEDYRDASEKPENKPENELKNLDPAAGLTFDIYEFTSMFLFFCHIQGDLASGALKDPDVWVGFKCGLGFSIDWFSINSVYYGTISTKADSKWQNHIEAYVSVSMGS